MPPMNELDRIEEWLLAKLLADVTPVTGLVPLLSGGGVDPAAARIFQDPVPLDKDLPALTFAHQGGPFGGGAIDLGAAIDINTAGPGHVCVQAPYIVKAVGDGPSALPLRPIVDRVDAILSDASGPAGNDAYVLGCKRISPVSYKTEEAGHVFRHHGFLFRIWAQPSAA